MEGDLDGLDVDVMNGLRLSQKTRGLPPPGMISVGEPDGYGRFRRPEQLRPRPRSRPRQMAMGMDNTMLSQKIHPIPSPS